ncbi:hypothetical protein L195_g037093, partial [Trifolium pratense]
VSEVKLQSKNAPFRKVTSEVGVCSKENRAAMVAIAAPKSWISYKQS